MRRTVVHATTARIARARRRIRPVERRRSRHDGRQCGEEVHVDVAASRAETLDARARRRRQVRSPRRRPRLSDGECARRRTRWPRRRSRLDLDTGSRRGPLTDGVMVADPDGGVSSGRDFQALRRGVEIRSRRLASRLGADAVPRASMQNGPGSLACLAPSGASAVLRWRRDARGRSTFRCLDGDIPDATGRLAPVRAHSSLRRHPRRRRRPFAPRSLP